MLYKIFITQISPEAAAHAEKYSKFSGVHFAKYCATSIDDSQTKMTTNMYTGDVISCLRKAMINFGVQQIALGNFKVSLTMQGKEETGKLDTISLIQLENSIDATVYGDGINALHRLKDSHAVAIANVQGKRGDTVTDYGCVLAMTDGTFKTTSWKNIKKNLQLGKFRAHNITLQGDSLQRTNLSALDTVYLLVKTEAKAQEQEPTDTTAPEKTEQSDKDTDKRKKKLMNDLVKAKSPMAYVLTDDYNLDAMQYIMKTKLQGEEIRYMLNPKYTAEQLRVLHQGVLKGLDITMIADPSVSARTMRSTLKKMEYDLWDCIDVQNITSDSNK